MDATGHPSARCLKRAESPSCMGIHVGLGVQHLCRTQVADMVASTNPNFSSGLVFGCLSLRMAWNGCGRVFGLIAAPTVPLGSRLVLVSVRHRMRGYLSVGGGPDCSAGLPIDKGLGRYVRDRVVTTLRNISPVGRHLPVLWNSGDPDHVESTPLEVAERILGKKMESGIPAACA